MSAQKVFTARHALQLRSTFVGQKRPKYFKLLKNGGVCGFFGCRCNQVNLSVSSAVSNLRQLVKLISKNANEFPVSFMESKALENTSLAHLISSSKGCSTKHMQRRYQPSRLKAPKSCMERDGSSHHPSGHFHKYRTRLLSTESLCRCGFSTLMMLGFI